jgi:hypothetical protein
VSFFCGSHLEEQLLMNPRPVNNLGGKSPRPVEPEELDNDSATTNKVRQGVTGHNVRYVLLLSLAGVVLAFIVAYLAIFGF